MVNAQDQVIGMLRPMKALDAVLDLQLVDALRLEEPAPARAQARRCAEVIEYVEPGSDLRRVVRAVECLRVEAQSGQHRPATPKREAAIPPGRGLEAVRFRPRGALQ